MSTPQSKLKLKQEMEQIDEMSLQIKYKQEQLEREYKREKSELLEISDERYGIENSWLLKHPGRGQDPNKDAAHQDELRKVDIRIAKAQEQGVKIDQQYQQDSTTLRTLKGNLDKMYLSLHDALTSEKDQLDQRYVINKSNCEDLLIQMEKGGGKLSDLPGMLKKITQEVMIEKSSAEAEGETPGQKL